MPSTFVSTLLVVSTLAPDAQRPAASSWQLTKQVDETKDLKEVTLVLPSEEGRSSLRVHCNSQGSYVVFLTFPKSVHLTDPTLVEVRFDSKKPAAYVMMRLSHDLLVTALGGSKIDANYAFATADPAKGINATFTPDDLASTATSLLKEIRSSARMVYRFPLAHEAEGAQAAFNVAGFEAAAVPLTQKCSIER